MMKLNRGFLRIRRLCDVTISTVDWGGVKHVYIEHRCIEMLTKGARIPCEVSSNTQRRFTAREKVSTRVTGLNKSH